MSRTAEVGSRQWNVNIGRSLLRYFLRHGVLNKNVSDPTELWPSVCGEDRSIWIAQGNKYRACITKEVVYIRKDSISQDIYINFARAHNRNTILLDDLRICHSGRLEDYHAPNWEAFPEPKFKDTRGQRKPKKPKISEQVRRIIEQQQALMEDEIRRRQMIEAEQRIIRMEPPTLSLDSFDGFGVDPQPLQDIQPAQFIPQGNVVYFNPRRQAWSNYPD